MSFVRPMLPLLGMLLGTTACSGAPHDLDLEDLKGVTVGNGAGPGTGAGTGTGTGTSTNPAGGGVMGGGVTWNGQVSGAVQGAGCTNIACHDAAATSGPYSLTSYNGALQHVTPGDPNSRLITRCGEAHEGCAVDATLYDLFYDWIVDSNAAQQ